MGKSPGRWIKTILLGKKSSKSNFSKSKRSDEKEALVAVKEPPTDLVVSAPLLSEQAPHATDNGEENLGLVKGTASILPQDPGLPSPVNPTTGFGLTNNADNTRQEQAAAIVQAAFRGYLARRAFRALKGIIRLQAVIRGHLVRRQAIATLHCVQGIVKLQALVRGRRVRLSGARFEVSKLADPTVLTKGTVSEKLSANVFVNKLHSSAPTALPLSLQYDQHEPNSAWKWVERWSSSHFWEPSRERKGNDGPKFKKKQNGSRLETERVKSKRTVRRVPTVNNSGSNQSPSSSEFENPKRSMRKSYNHQADPLQENPQNELERVKRSLRKVSVSTVEANDRSESVTEKPTKQTMKKVLTRQAPDVSEKVLNHSSENTSDPTVPVPKQPVMEVDNNHPVQDLALLPLENGGKDEKVSTINNDLNSKEDQTSTENERMRRRRSLPVKQEQPENDGSQKNTTLPSYMAATQSAKAKLRLGQNGAENGSTRRHSLPSSTNGKSNSFSPRMPKLVQANAKGVKSDRSLSSSRDVHDKVTQVEWRR